MNVSRRFLIVSLIVLLMLVIAMGSFIAYYEFGKTATLSVMFKPNVTKNEALDAVQGWEKNIFIARSDMSKTEAETSGHRIVGKINEKIATTAGMDGTDIFVGIAMDWIQGLILKSKLEKDPRVQLVFIDFNL